MQVDEFQTAPNGQPAIALRCSQPFAADAGFQDQLAVYHAQTGKRLNGVWQRASDPSLLYFVLPAAGRYILRLRAGLRDAAGHTLNQALSGPVEVSRPQPVN